MNSTVYVILCGAILGVISAWQGISYSENFARTAWLNWPAIAMISIATLPIIKKD